MDEPDLVAQDGRAVGRRGAQTRRKLLDATAQLLEHHGVRDLRVVDNGRGFDLNNLSDEERLGIRGMFERSVAIGGKLDLESRPGQGTAVIFQMENGNG